MKVKARIATLTRHDPEMAVVLPSDDQERAQDYVAVSEVTVDTVSPERGHPINLQLADDRDGHFRCVVRLH